MIITIDIINNIISCTILLLPTLHYLGVHRLMMKIVDWILNQCSWSRRSWTETVVITGWTDVVSAPRHSSTRLFLPETK